MRERSGATTRPATRLSVGDGLHGSLHLADGSIGTVVCVHGALDGGASFARVRRRLPACDVVTYDRRGYRASRSAGVADGLGPHVEDLFDVVAAARAAGARAPVVVLGHSFGGLVALGAAASAAAQPTPPAALVLYEPPFPWRRHRTEDPHPAPTSDPGAAAESFFRRIVGDGAWERLSASERTSRRLDGPALVSDLTVLTAECPVDLAKVTVPVVVGLSAGAPPRRAESAAALVAALADATVVDFHRAGHGAHLSSPGQLASVTDGVLRRVVT